MIGFAKLDIIFDLYAGEIRKNQALPKRQELVRVWF